MVFYKAENLYKILILIVYIIIVATVRNTSYSILLEEYIVKKINFRN